MDENSIFTAITRMKHNYTSEIELKSLLIRVQKKTELKLVQFDFEDKKIKMNNDKINKYIKWYNSLQQSSKIEASKFSAFKKKLKTKIIELSTVTPIDSKSYEMFGEIILLMVKNILRKPQFSGYTYKDDFYSDAIHKILKYIRNFKYDMISERTGDLVNAFAYISQIIHNSVIFVIKQKNKEKENIRHVISLEVLYNDFDLNNFKSEKMHNHSVEQEKVQNVVKIDVKCTSEIFDALENIHNTKEKQDVKFIIEYPKSAVISFEEYDKLRPLLKGIDIVRAKN